MRWLLDLVDLSGPMTSTSRAHIRIYVTTLNSPMGRYNPPPAAHPLTPTTHLLPPAPPFPNHPPTVPPIHKIHDITVPVKKLLKSSSVSYNY